MNQKGIAPLIIVAIVAVIAVAVGVAVYVATREEGAGPGPGPGGVAGATSLSFKVDYYDEGQLETVTFKAKNIGSPNLKLRVENWGGNIVVIDEGAEKAWLWSSDEGWEDVSARYTYWLGEVRMPFDLFRTKLSGWTGGDYTFTEEGHIFRIYDVKVNPDLSDSIFRPSTS
jgi:hypothetical protein